MENAKKILDLVGGLESLKRKTRIDLSYPALLNLSFEYYGKGPRGGDMVILSHPENLRGWIVKLKVLRFELDEMERWHPVSYHHHLGEGLSSYILNSRGEVVAEDSAMKRRLRSCAAEWNEELLAAGYEVHLLEGLAKAPTG